MGARVNFVFKTDEDPTYPRIVLYSHWGETTWREDLAVALNAAQNRLKINDTSYATRIIIDQLTRDGRDSETGYGIYLAPENMDYGDEVVEIDMIKQLVNDNGSWHSFASFISYMAEVMEYHSV